ncbi:MAG: hypothetical protein IJH61_09285 [Eubacteriaceae bacterium]|nr:hypothetical protein [Eubacteriaceae bacterium]
MKFLNQFVYFDWNRFAEGKVFMVTGLTEWQDFETKAYLGTKIECVILTDNTKYENKDGQKASNRFEKIVFKVNKNVDIPMDSRIVPKNVTANVYGDYRNQLSVKCTDVGIIK